MIQNVLSGISGVGIYGVISIGIFIAVFVGVVVWTLRLKQPYLSAMREMPLADDPAPATRLDSKPNTEVSHE